MRAPSSMQARTPPPPPTHPNDRSFAIDATHYGRHDVLAQFAPHELERELNKALAGFSRPAHDPLYSHGGSGRRRRRHWRRLRNSEDEMDLPDACAPEGELHGRCFRCAQVTGGVARSAVTCSSRHDPVGRRVRCRPPADDVPTFSDEALADSAHAPTARLRQNGCTVAQLVRLLARFQPRKWPHSPSARATGHYADLFRFLDGRCEREEARRREGRRDSRAQGSGKCEVAGAPMAEVALEATGSGSVGGKRGGKVAEAAEAADAEATEVVTEATREARRWPWTLAVSVQKRMTIQRRTRRRNRPAWQWALPSQMSMVCERWQATKSE